ncbi:MAG: DDE-type integrase/transposase/recombinase [Planctomycetes bacterium]|nr:DDE-type integrase/transposase/recombinase [Planctomycetota bacterium]MCO5167807.1 DDE-type integrase/transposase/recombinase [Planctomycetota bacterium]
MVALLDAVADSAVRVAATLGVDAPRARRRRGLPGQWSRRQREHLARRAVVEARDQLNACGLSLSRFCESLGRSERTLRRWAERHADPFDRLTPVALGRPPKRGTALERNLVVAALGELGPFTPVASLRQLAPGLARREVEELCWRHRVHMRVAGHATAQTLAWHRPGAVWAVDYTEVPWRVDGREKHVLSVRDLASGYHLLALVAEHADARTTRDALASLFATHGPPLVLKSDNGGHFADAGVRALLDEHGVLHLRSPAGWPAYNGACESGIHWLKARAFQFAVREGRTQVSAGDLGAAVCLGNDLLRRVRGAEQTPTQVWSARQPISDGERHELRLVFERRELEARATRGHHPEALLSDDQRADVEREAISRALHERGLLTTRRRSIPLPAKR